MASGRINGICKGPGASAYDFWVEWSSTVNEEENCSFLNATAYLQRNDGNSNSAYNLDLKKEKKYIDVDGEITYSTEKGIDTRYLKRVTIAKILSKKIPHDPDGTKRITISAAVNDIGAISLYSASLSKVVVLDTIDSDPLVFTAQPSVMFFDQTSAEISYEVDGESDYAEYSLDGQKTWTQIFGNSFSVSGLSPFTQYQIYVRVRKATNGKLTVSDVLKFATLPTYLTEIILPESVSVDIGQTIQLPYSFLPENASMPMIAISSSDPNIISASGSEITGIKRGSATLTVYAIDGSGLSYSMPATAIRRVSGITIKPEEITISKGSEIPLYFNIQPSDADNKAYTLSTSDPALVSVSGNMITGVENGTVSITAITEDGGFVAECKVTVVGEYVWYDYSEPLEVLNTEDVQHIQANMQTIRSMLLSKGYAVESLENVNPGKNTPFIEMLAILQNIEYNLDRLNGNDCKSLYYLEPKIVGSRASNYNDIWRWIQILNEMYLILTGTFGKWQYILLNDGYPTIAGKRLLIRGDKVV